METRVLFTKGSKPLSETEVVFDGVAGDYRTDEDGIVELELAPGAHRARIEYAGEPLELRFVVEDDGLQVVDVGAHLDKATADTSALPDDVPTVISGRYRVEHLLGRGGMGVVVKAWDDLLERPVAIKFLNQELADSAEAREIFLKEARSLAKLSHERLVAVHDVTVDENKPIMVTEFVDGTDLGEILHDSGPMSMDRAVEVVRSIAEGLGYMHEHGLIHRDIKPGNVISRPSGELKLIDFGLARSLEHLTTKGTRVRGTPAYMAPEQVEGESLGPATDVYQLGITLFELLTGEVPYPDDPYGLAHVKEDVPAVRDYNPEVPAALADFLEHCLAKEPTARPAGGYAVLEGLKALGGAPSDAGRASGGTAGPTDSSRAVEPRDSETGDTPRDGETGWNDADALPSNHTLRNLFIALGVAVLGAAGLLIAWMSGPEDETDAPETGEEQAVASTREAEDTGRERDRRPDASITEEPPVEARDAAGAPEDTADSSDSGVSDGAETADGESGDGRDGGDSEENAVDDRQASGASGSTQPGDESETGAGTPGDRTGGDRAGQTDDSPPADDDSREQPGSDSSGETASDDTTDDDPQSDGTESGGDTPGGDETVGGRDDGSDSDPDDSDQLPDDPLSVDPPDSDAPESPTDDKDGASDDTTKTSDDASDTSGDPAESSDGPSDDQDDAPSQNDEDDGSDSPDEDSNDDDSDTKDPSDFF